MNDVKKKVKVKKNWTCSFFWQTSGKCYHTVKNTTDTKNTVTNLFL